MAAFDRFSLSGNSDAAPILEEMLLNFARYITLGRSVGVASAALIAAVPAIAGPAADMSIQAQTTRDYRLTGSALIMGGTGVPLSIPPDNEDLIGSLVNAT